MADPKYFGGWGNHVLYRMCNEQPGHTNADIVGGKLWLIGRAYAAAIERGAGKAVLEKAKKEKKDLHDVIAADIARSNLVDGWLASIDDVKHVDRQNLSRVLAVHRQFVDLLKELTDGKRATRRSFASKYLHFHKPNAFFIFDSRAQKEIARRCKKFPRSTELKLSDLSLPLGVYDQTYADFVLRCIQYRDEEAKRRGGPPMIPRQLDQELLGYGTDG